MCSCLIDAESSALVAFDDAVLFAIIGGKSNNGSDVRLCFFCVRSFPYRLAMLLSAFQLEESGRSRRRMNASGQGRDCSSSHLPLLLCCSVEKVMTKASPFLLERPPTNLAEKPCWMEMRNCLVEIRGRCQGFCKPQNGWLNYNALDLRIRTRTMLSMDTMTNQ